jgi:outer membrane protein assembly factor BamB
MTGGEGSSDHLWRISLLPADRDVDAALAADGKRLFMLAGALVAFDPTGNVRWRVPLDGETHRPRNLSIHSGRLFAAGAMAHAIDAESGKELWRAEFPRGATASLGRGAADADRFYVGTDAHTVYAFDAGTGLVRWATDVGAEWKFRGVVTGITIQSDTLYVGVRQSNAENGYISTGWIFALDRTSGRVLWSFANGTGADWRTVSSGPTVAGRLLLVSDHLSGAVFAVDRFTGLEVWRRLGPVSYFGPLASPIPVDNTAYVASVDMNVYALDIETGAIRWKVKNPGGNLSFAVCGRDVYATYLGLSVLDRSSGKVIRRTESEIFGEAVAGDGTAFVYGNRALHAFTCR